MKDREYDPRREFEEELLETDLLPEDEFKKLRYRKVWEDNGGVTYSNRYAFTKWYMQIFLK